jgi:hypothetical protein
MPPSIWTFLSSLGGSEVVRLMPALLERVHRRWCTEDLSGRRGIGSPPPLVTHSPDHLSHGKLAAWRFKNFALGFINKYGVPGIQKRVFIPDRRRGGGKKKTNGIHKDVDKITKIDDTP